MKKDLLHFNITLQYINFNYLKNIIKIVFKMQNHLIALLYCIID